MPHDRNGNELKVGDHVNVPCIVTAVQPGADYCNVSLNTELPMHPGDHFSQITLNTRQTIKVINKENEDGITG